MYLNTVSLIQLSWRLYVDCICMYIMCSDRTPIMLIIVHQCYVVSSIRSPLEKGIKFSILIISIIIKMESLSKMNSGNIFYWLYLYFFAFVPVKVHTMILLEKNVLRSECLSLKKTQMFVSPLGSKIYCFYYFDGVVYWKIQLISYIMAPQTLNASDNCVVPM